MSHLTSFDLFSLPTGTTLRTNSPHKQLFEMQLDMVTEDLRSKQRRAVLLLTSPKGQRLPTLGVSMGLEPDAAIEVGQQMTLYRDEQVIASFELKGFEVVDPA